MFFQLIKTPDIYRQKKSCPQPTHENSSDAIFRVFPIESWSSTTFSIFPLSYELTNSQYGLQYCVLLSKMLLYNVSCICFVFSRRLYWLQLVRRYKTSQIIFATKASAYSPLVLYFIGFLQTQFHQTMPSFRLVFIHSSI